MAVPTNQFGLQEPGANSEIMNGISAVRPGGGFLPDYRVAEKDEVNGATESALFSYLKAACPGPSNLLGSTDGFYFTPIKQNDLTWNFEKFLIDSTGQVVRRYSPNTLVDAIRPDIEELIDLAKEAKEIKLAAHPKMAPQKAAKKH